MNAHWASTTVDRYHPPPFEPSPLVPDSVLFSFPEPSLPGGGPVTIKLPLPLLLLPLLLLSLLLLPEESSELAGMGSMGSMI